MKRLLSYFIVLTIIVGLAFGIVTANAASAKGTTILQEIFETKVGETITAKFTFSATKIAYVSAYVTYDASVLEFDSSKSSSSHGMVDFNPNASGRLLFSIIHASGSDSITLTLSFKAKTAGSSYLGIKNGDFDECTNSDENEIIFTGAGQNIRVSDSSSAKSSDATLSRMTISAGTLTPSFSPDVTTYSVTIPNNITTFTVSVNPTAGSRAKVDVEGSKDMKVGTNQRVVVVTAEDGTEKRYTINITRLAANGSTPEPPVQDPENPIDEQTTVTVDGSEKYISEAFDTNELYPGYAIDIFTYNDKEFPCIKKGDSVLVYLTDADGGNGAFYRAVEDGSFESFAYMHSESRFYEFLKAPELPEGYSEISMDIAGCKVTAYQNGDSEFVLVYAKGPDGNTGFYRYDTVEQTLQRAGGITTSTQNPADTEPDKQSGSIIDNINSLDTPTKVIAITIVGVILLLIVAIIVLIIKIARPADYDDKTEYEVEEQEDETDDFEFVSISDRDSTEEE